MNTLSSKTPYDFIKSKVTLSWSDILYGMQHFLIAPKIAVQHADDLLCHSSVPNSKVCEVVGNLNDASVLDVVQSLSSQEGDTSEQLIKDKWLFLLLAWIYENKDDLADPLGVVETVYSDFDYPKAMEPFVRYMPMREEDAGTSEKNIARLFDYWAEYLNCAGASYRNRKNVIE